MGAGSESTFRGRLDYQGGKYDRLGFDDGRRALPAAVSPAQPLRSPTEAYPSTESRYQAARTFHNSWQMDAAAPLPGWGSTSRSATPWKLARQRRFGYLLTAGYENDSVRRLGTTRPNPIVGAGGSLIARNEYRVETGVEEVQLAGLGTASLDLGPDHSLTVLSLFNRSVSDETSLQTGNAVEFGGSYLENGSSITWPARSGSTSSSGTIAISSGSRLRLRWALFHAYAERDEPDRRTVAYGDNAARLRR